MLARISRQQARSTVTSNRCIRDEVVTVEEFRSKRCLPSLKFCSGCIRWRYIFTANLGSDYDVARYHGSLCLLPQNNTRLIRTAWSWRYCAPLMKMNRRLRSG